MGNRDLPHIFVRSKPKAEPFRSANGGGNDKEWNPVANPNEHGKRLTRELKEALGSLNPSKEIEREGTYITFESFPGLDLALKSLDPRLRGERPELVAVRKVPSTNGDILEATVYIPDGEKEYFVRKLNEYVETSAQSKRKNANLVEGIKRIGRATIRELWTDPDDEFPHADDISHWWELWLRKRDGNEAERLESFAEKNGLKTSANYLGFGDRTVALLHATVEQLTTAFESLDDLAELRRPHEIPSALSDLAPYEQKEWIDELLERINYAGNGTPAVCILDRGVDSAHPLLAPALNVDSLHSVSQDWKHNPVLNPHGTEMAGLALFGTFKEIFGNRHPVNLKHQLESVKILPDHGEHDPDVYGAVTARAVDQPEITNIERKRVFMMAVTARQSLLSPPSIRNEEDNIAGRPSGWSAAVDALAYGRAIDDTKPQFTYLDRDEKRTPRLFVISAGNIRFLESFNPNIDLTENHLERSDGAAVEDPAQAWNAITVGAYSESDDMDGAGKGVQRICADC